MAEQRRGRWQPPPAETPPQIDVTIPEPLSLLVFGPSYGGKTTFCGTAPDLAYIDTERGTNALADLYQRTGQRPVSAWRCHTREHMTGILDTLLHPEAQKHYRSVAFDSLTDSQELITLQVMDEHHAVYGRDYAIPDQLETQDWQRILIPELRILRKLRQMRYYVICTAQAWPLLDPLSKPEVRREQMLARARGEQYDTDLRKRLYPFLKGQLADLVAHCFDVVAYMQYMESEQRWRAYFRPSKAWYAKTRFSQLPDYLDDPSFGLVLDYVEGRRTAEPETNAAEEESTTHVETPPW